MLLSGHSRLLAAGALVAATAIPATFIASDASLAATVELLPVAIAAPAAGNTAEAVDAVIAQDRAGTEGTGNEGDAAASPDAAIPDVADGRAATAAMDADLECIAKVVLHEAGNQPRAGQLAVAQLIVNRVESGRFADDACGVVNQPGQFFQTSGYHPRRDTAEWADAVAAAREARLGRTADVAPGAMFFRASYAPANDFFRGRTRVVTLGDHVFYR